MDMKILIAEDDVTSRAMLAAVLKKWGFDPVVTDDGSAAWQAMQTPDARPGEDQKNIRSFLQWL
jgi:DNA-binding response OmpR family regulator